MAENDSHPLPDDLFAKVEGFISLPEAELLNRLAREVSTGGNIIEVGSYRARSTIALALGAKEVGATVWAIDPHPTYEQGGTQFGMFDNIYYYENIAAYGVGGVVKTLNITSTEAFILWSREIDLVWIDGDHTYEKARLDWYLWSVFTDVVALHDTAGHHEGINRLVGEILDSGNWERSEVVDSITVFRSIEQNGK